MCLVGDPTVSGRGDNPRYVLVMLFVRENDEMKNDLHIRRKKNKSQMSFKTISDIDAKKDVMRSWQQIISHK